MALPVINFTPNTPLKFMIEQTTQGLPGQGTSTKDVLVTTDFKGEKVEVFWAEWRGDHGTVKATLYNSGVKESATVRMAFIPEIYEALRRGDVAIFYNPKEGEELKRNSEDSWEIFGQPDNIGNMGIIMEYQVRRYEAK